MNDAARVLPSWRPGATREALLDFLEAATSLPPEQRVACFDNDGTLWCERPAYPQYEFFVDALRRRSADDPDLRRRPEFAALLDEGRDAVGELGLVRIALALVSLFEGQTPEEFTAEVRAFMGRAVNPALGRPVRTAVYLPMLELIDELRSRDFTVTIVSGGGCEFVRAVGQELYGVPPEAVVGTLVRYRFGRDDSGRPLLRRTGEVLGDVNEGPAKVSAVQTHLGRAPVLAAGNSGGDRELLEWATAGPGPGLALLVDHDDAEREFAYAGAAGSFTDPEPITDVARRLGWTVASMRNDWARVFPDAPGPDGVSR